MSPTAAVILAEGFETVEALTPVDVLRRLGVRVAVLGLDSRVIRSAQGVEINADRRLDEYDLIPDAVILPGGLPGADHLGRSDLLRRLVLAVGEAGGVQAAICAAPARAFGPFGILKGRRVTCYPSLERELPKESTLVRAPVVEDGQLITSRGPATALSFAFAIARRLAGKAEVDALARQMLL
ncbi:DJ-1/PfpI family protein [Myxococcota bacterium]|nr:DJ-1/PfpI family protein [Myxococcota bacterium]MBU1433125.1 DJ-1/PfpI family protein [Myxococcota bacterium]MBU1900723.1 DJ-1/PfpI family protein [Myxococcota bacterium]